MDEAKFGKLLKKLQSDEALLHSIIFSPEDAVKELGFLDRADQDNLLKVSPEAVIQGIVSGKGRASDCGVTVQCGETCTHTSSLQNVMLQGVDLMADCGVTVQCTSTCGHTSSIADKIGVRDLTADIGAAIRARGK
jgi:hypothetical protein